MIVQAALNGARKREFHPNVPHLLDQLAADAVAAIRAGASEFHAHVYADTDRESLEPGAVARWVTTLRSVAPGAFIGISSGDWIENDDALRLDYINRWAVLPDHASVNLDEDGAVDVIRALHARGVGIEAGISTVEDVAKLQDSGLAPIVLRVLVEVSQDDSVEAMLEADRVVAALSSLPSPKPILMHGFNVTAWPFLNRAISSNYSIRIGLEDTKVLPDGTPAGSNVELVRAAVALVEQSRNG